MWVYNKKRTKDGSVKYKARLVAKGCGQVPQVDFRETFAPTARATSLRLLITIAVMKGLSLNQYDFETAFLNGKLNEEIFLEQPTGYAQEGSEKMV